MKLLENIAQLATCRAEGGQGEIHAIADAALVWEGDTIRWVGPRARAAGASTRAAERLDAGGGLVIPGLVDCHTHLAFGGWRAEEFEQRILGRSYLEIAAAGGGIARTVRLTRAASEDELLERARRASCARCCALGVTTVECKSGYGLDREQRAAGCSGSIGAWRRGSRCGWCPTFLGAHVVPPEFRDDRAGYLALLERRCCPQVARERLARVLRRVRGGVGVHRRRRRGGCSAAAQRRGPRRQAARRPAQRTAAARSSRPSWARVSADHLECASPAGIAAMARAGVVAVSLPIASLYLGQPPFAGAAVDRRPASPVAVATDFNPGSAPSYHLPFALTLACTLQRMTPAEALKGATSTPRARSGWRTGSARSSRARRPTSPCSTRRTWPTGCTTSSPTPAGSPSPAGEVAWRGPRDVGALRPRSLREARARCACWAPSCTDPIPQYNSEAPWHLACWASVCCLALLTASPVLAQVRAADRTGDESADGCSRFGGDHLGGPERNLRPHRQRRPVLDERARGRPDPHHPGHRVQAPARDRSRREQAGERDPRARPLQAGRDRGHRSVHRHRAAEPAQRGGDGRRRRAHPRADRHARESALQGKIPGALIQQNSGAPGGGIQVNLRGVSTINAGTEPL